MTQVGELSIGPVIYFIIAEFDTACKKCPYQSGQYQQNPQGPVYLPVGRHKSGIGGFFIFSETVNCKQDKEKGAEGKNPENPRP